ncbi:MAG: DUF6484 domain-containing protein [Pseudomonadota bacterium]
MEKIDGVVVGMIMEIDGTVPMVVFAESTQDGAVPARSVVDLTTSDIGKQVALSFERGDPTSPIILGRFSSSFVGASTALTIDGKPEPLVYTGQQEVVLRCGKASITLTRAGKILLRGTYLSSRSSGVNRIKGGSVQLN